YLNRLVAFRQSTGEFGNAGMLAQRFWPKAFERTLVQCEPAKVARVLKYEIVMFEFQHNGCMFGQCRLFWLEIHPPAHSEMAEDNERCRRLRSEMKNQEFRST